MFDLNDDDDDDPRLILVLKVTTPNVWQPFDRLKWWKLKPKYFNFNRRKRRSCFVPVRRIEIRIKTVEKMITGVLDCVWIILWSFSGTCCIYSWTWSSWWWSCGFRIKIITDLTCDSVFSLSFWRRFFNVWTGIITTDCCFSLVILGSIGRDIAQPSTQLAWTCSWIDNNLHCWTQFSPWSL